MNADTQPAAVPDGWKLVPIEPTDAMYKAGYNTATMDCTGAWVTDALKCYAAMLMAAPLTPQEAASGAVQVQEVALDAAPTQEGAERSVLGGQGRGTFSCPICGLDTPHNHYGDEVARYRARRLYCTDAEGLDECLSLMFPNIQPDSFRTDGGNINMPKVRAVWAEQKEIDNRLHFALERARQHATFFRFDGDGQFGSWEEARSDDPRATAFYTAGEVKKIVNDALGLPERVTAAAPSQPNPDAILSSAPKLEPTPEMVQAYLTANDAYWRRTDEQPHLNPSKWRNGTPAEATAESLRAVFALLPAADMTSAPGQGAARLWLWKNFVDGKPEYWAFDNPYPCETVHGDPLTLGQPCGWAILKPSVNGRPGLPESEVIEAAIRRAAPPLAGDRKQEPAQPCAMCATPDLCQIHGCAKTAIEREAAAQPGVVDAAWVEKAMKLAEEWATRDAWIAAQQWPPKSEKFREAEAAREALRTHLSTALAGAERGAK